MEYGNKVKLVRQALGLSQTELGEKLNMPTMTVSRIESGERELKVNELTKLEEEFSVNSRWLITGKGEMFLEPEERGLMNNIRVPIIDVKASAGQGVINYIEGIKGYIEIPTYLLPYNSGVVEIVEVLGDSMEPTLRNGEAVIIDRNAGEIQSGEIYLINIDGELRLKRLEKKINGSLFVFSDNPSFTPEEITKDQLDLTSVHIIGKVLVSMRVHSGRVKFVPKEILE